MKAYKCTGCGNETPRENLTVKRVQFTTMGKGYQTLRSRTVAWICPDCRNRDPAWTQEAVSDAPGNVHA